MEDPSEYIDFLAKYKEWISIKRLGIRADTKPEEVVFHLAGIRNTVDQRSYKILGINVAKLDEIASKLSSGKAKKYAGLSDIAKELSSQPVKREIAEAVESQTLQKFAEIYVLNKAMAAIGLDTAITQESLQKLYPELKLKIPKGLGRKKE
ncbi:MAG: DUF2666 family protein [Candidatus Micrarchaeaceae archaeon]